MATISDAIQHTLREGLEPGIIETLPKMDPIYANIKRTKQGVIRNPFGRSHQVKKTFSVGIAGGAKFTNPNGASVLSGPDNFNVLGSPAGFPAYDETTLPAFFQMTTDLIEQRGTFFVPHQLLRIDEYDSSIGSVVAQILKGVSRLVAHQECVTFYAGDGTLKTLGDVGDTSANIANLSGDTAAVTINLSGASASGRVHRFLQGMLIDIYDSTGATKRNLGYTLAIDDVDPLNNTITVRRLDGGEFQVTTVLNGGTTFATAGSDNDIMVIKDSVSTGPNGLNSWISDSGTLFGITLADHSMFKSYKPSALNAALSESLLNKHYFRFYESYPDKVLDTAITTNGVLMGLLDNLDINETMSRIDRTNDPLMVSLGWEGFKYRFGGRPVTVWTSTFAERTIKSDATVQGDWYAIKLADGNLTRYVPPELPSARKDGQIGQELEFIAPAFGSTGIFTFANKPDGGISDYAQAPFVRQWQILPEDPVSMKLTGINELAA